MSGELNMMQVTVTALVTALSTGAITVSAQFLSFRGMFNEFKEDIKRRVEGVQLENDKKVSMRECEKTHARNDKDHDEMFGRLREAETEIVEMRRTGGAR